MRAVRADAEEKMQNCSSILCLARGDGYVCCGFSCAVLLARFSLCRSVRRTAWRSWKIQKQKLWMRLLPSSD